MDVDVMAENTNQYATTPWHQTGIYELHYLFSIIFLKNLNTFSFNTHDSLKKKKKAVKNLFYFMHIYVFF